MEVSNIPSFPVENKPSRKQVRLKTDVDESIIEVCGHRWHLHTMFSFRSCGWLWETV